MADYTNPEKVGRFLERIDLEILGTSKGDFSPEHTKYDCRLLAGGSDFRTSYQSNPSVHGEPTVADVFAAIASDAELASRYGIDDFADELGFEKPSQAIRAYEGCMASRDWLHDKLYLSMSELQEMSQTLDENLDEIKESVSAAKAQRAKDEAYRNPPVPEGFRSIDDLESSLDLGEYGDQITEHTGNIGDAFGEIADNATDIYTYDMLKWLPDNYEWLEEADFQGLLEGCKGDLIKMTQMAQYVCFTQDMYNHQKDIAKYAALEGLSDAGIYAISVETYNAVFESGDIGFDDNNMDIEDFASEAQAAIQDAMDAPIYEAIGSNDEIMEDGKLHGDYEAIKASGYDFPNPCAMSAGAVRAVNEMGYDAAFSEFWKDFMQDGRDASATQEVTLIPVTLHFNDTPGCSESATFSVQDTEGLDLDEKVLFSGLSHEELTEMVGKQTGEDFTIESVGEPYQVKASAKDKPSLSEVANETRDSSAALESRAESAEPSPEKKHPEH